MISRYRPLSFLGIFTLLWATSSSVGAFPRFYPQQISLQFPATGDRGSPLTTRGGGTRGPNGCLVNEKEGSLSVNALTPNYSGEMVTVSANPNLYYYIPATTATLGELILHDDNGHEIYQTTFSLPREAGIIKVSTAPSPTLLPNQNYQWFLNIICDSQQRTEDMSFEGTLKYKKINNSVISIDKDPLEKAKFYASQGIWVETLDNLAKARSQHPQDWKELLDSAGLPELMTEPLIACCEAKALTPISTHNTVQNPTFNH
ncbi:MAG: DUF928 domain-containing protein [Snowella sp.]|nr:DUF928 domain-containing protein [Snowella sp.]